MVARGERTQTELFVIGAGPGGYVAAIRAAQLGREVMLVEREAYGGTCLNYGCIPSKSLITAGNRVEWARDGGEMGIGADVSVDFGQLIGWKDDVVDRLTSGVESLCKQAGVTLVDGRAVFVDESTAQIIYDDGNEDAETVDFDHAIIATGSSTIEIPSLPFEEERILDARQALDLESVPDHLLVVGAGYIGMELATAFRKLGADVTVVEMLNEVLPQYEEKLTRVVHERAEELGVEFKFGRRATDYRLDNDAIHVEIESDSSNVAEVAADRTLVAVGREPISGSVEPDAAGIEVDNDGFIPTDDFGRTETDSIYAIGDVAGEPLLAHQAMYEGQVVAEVITGEPAALDARAVPAVVFTDPEIAVVGMTESDAADAGFEPIVGEIPLASIGRTLTLDYTSGFVRVVADSETEIILGAQLVAPEASELVGELGLVVEMSATLTDVAKTIHTHPTLSEAITEAAEDALGRAIHTP